MNFKLEPVPGQQPTDWVVALGRPCAVVESGHRAIMIGQIAGDEYRVSLVDTNASGITAFVDLHGWRINDACEVVGTGLIAVARGEYDGGYEFEGDVLLWDPGSGQVQRLLRDCGSALSSESDDRGAIHLRLSPLYDEELDDNDEGTGDEPAEGCFSYVIKPSKVTAGKTLRMKPRKRIRHSGCSGSSTGQLEGSRAKQAAAYLKSALGVVSPPLTVTSMVGADSGALVLKLRSYTEALAPAKGLIV